MDNCAICFDELTCENKFRSAFCTCKLFYHQTCYREMVKQNNIFCGYCRNQPFERKINLLNARNNNINADEEIVLRWFNQVFDLFVGNPSFTTFFVMMFLSLILTLFYVLPKLVYITVQHYFDVTKIDIGALVVSHILCYIYFIVNPNPIKNFPSSVTIILSHFLHKIIIKKLLRL